MRDKLTFGAFATMLILIAWLAGGDQPADSQILPPGHGQWVISSVDGQPTWLYHTETGTVYRMYSSCGGSGVEQITVFNTDTGRFELVNNPDHVPSDMPNGCIQGPIPVKAPDNQTASSLQPNPYANYLYSP